MSDVFLVDFSRPPNARERAALQRRLDRLQLLQVPAQRAMAAFEKASAGRRVPMNQILIRNGFSYLESPAPGDASDRRLPDPSDRPPATRVLTAKGAHSDWS